MCGANLFRRGLLVRITYQICTPYETTSKTVVFTKSSSLPAITTSSIINKIVLAPNKPLAPVSSTKSSTHPSYHYLQYFAHLAYDGLPMVMWPAEQIKCFHLAGYTLEMCLLDSRIIMKHPPSKLAAAALFMAKKVSSRPRHCLWRRRWGVRDDDTPI